MASEATPCFCLHGTCITKSWLFLPERSQNVELHPTLLTSTCTGREEDTHFRKGLLLSISWTWHLLGLLDRDSRATLAGAAQSMFRAVTCDPVRGKHMATRLQVTPGGFIQNMRLTEADRPVLAPALPCPALPPPRLEAAESYSEIQPRSAHSPGTQHSKTETGHIQRIFGGNCGRSTMRGLRSSQAYIREFGSKKQAASTAQTARNKVATKTRNARPQGAACIETPKQRLSSFSRLSPRYVCVLNYTTRGFCRSSGRLGRILCGACSIQFELTPPNFSSKPQQPKSNTEMAKSHVTVPLACVSKTKSLTVP